MREQSLLAAESFRQILFQGPYSKIDRLLEIVGRDSYALLESLADGAVLSSKGDLELPVFFTQPESLYSHYSFWKIISLLKDKPLWFYHLESFGLSGLRGDEDFRFPPALDDCPCLSLLILKNMDISVFPPEILNLRTLRILDLRGNKIPELPPGIGRLRQLVYFSAADNDLDKLPEQIARLKKLQILNLSGNRITDMPFSLDSFGRLKRLNLSGNCLESLPRGLDSLCHLERLLLAYNDLEAEEEALWESSYSSRIPGYQWHFAF